MLLGTADLKAKLMSIGVSPSKRIEHEARVVAVVTT